ncbi:hypothetical protein OH779_11175 [Actinacidiphila glaucinigra]|uniref:hypothetical protein n=1 Tax=Actinacidiphila glaucinigra TaxID=235986 RepID=UPI00386CA718
MTTTPTAAPPQPYRWSLSRARGGVPPDRLGALTEGAASPSLWYLPELTVCTGKVLARSGGADLCFVGRSLDSMYDLLTGAFEGSSREGPPLRLPLSLRLRRHPAPAHTARLREHLAAAGLAPHALARRTRPVALVDLVSEGGTYDTLFAALADWVRESREPWPAIRRKLRFVGVTHRRRTSPNTWRWQQNTAGGWARSLPSGHVAGVSLHPGVWSYFGDEQAKLQPSFPPPRWFDAYAAEPWHGPDLPAALAESLALVEAGRGRSVRAELVRVIAREPGFADREVRALVAPLRGLAPSRSRPGAVSRGRSGSRQRSLPRASMTGRSRSSSA